MTSASNSKTTLAVIGASSMVGSRFCQLTEKGRGFELVKADLNSNIPVDITNKKSVDSFFKKYSQNFDWVVLFSAYTDVDGAQKQRGDKNGSCWQINVDGTTNIVKNCARYNRGLIFTSTDFVFDGQEGPYSEDDPVGGDLKKVSWYGITKIEAEKIIQSGIEKFLILRITYPYRAKFAGKDDIVKRIFRLYKQGNLYPMFDDQITSPTFIDDLKETIALLISKKSLGIFHIASPRTVSFYEFAKRAIKTFGGNPADVKKGSIGDFLSRPNSTPRPIKGGLRVGKISDLGFTPTDWKKGLEVIYLQSVGKLI